MAFDPAGRVALGRTRLYVSRLGLGTAPIGGLFQPVPEADALATIQRAHALGLRLFDTAPLYGHGVAERRLGRALRDLPRHEVVVSTKVGRLLRADAPLDPSQHRPDGSPYYHATPALNIVWDFSAEGVRRSLAESLERLGLERVDVLYLHDPDAHERTARDEALPTLLRLRAEGVVSAVGAGMNQAAMLARFARSADLDCLLLAGRYSLLDHATALDDLLPLCQARGIGVVVGGVFNSGVLADPRPGATFDYLPVSPSVLARVERLSGLCQRYGVPLKAAALQFPLAHPAVACVLTGARTPAELDENARLLRLPIPAGLWRDLRTAGLLDPRAPIPHEDGGRA